MDLSLGFVHQVDQLWSQLVESLQVDGTSLIRGKHCKGLQRRLSGQFVVQSVSENRDNLVNLLL